MFATHNCTIPQSCSCVQTRRTRTAGKVDIPSVDDHVSKLEHMGRETVKKLSDVLDAAHQAGIDDLNLQVGTGKRLCIETVGAFQQLVLAAENVRILHGIDIVELDLGLGLTL